MKTRNIVIIVIVIIVVITMFNSFRGGDDLEAYTEEIQQEREDKDHFLRTSSESPIAEKDRKDFKGLNYFPPDLKYRISASLTPVKEKNVIVLYTNDGEEERYLPYAYADFDFDKQNNKLLILEIMEGENRGTLFLAFGDETSARETYGAGRYLDVKKVPGASTITLDFNKAYNPYCAYNDGYSCPMPPKENLLHIPIPAGEKTYHVK